MQLLQALGCTVLVEKEDRACLGSGWVAVYSERFTMCVPQSGSSWLLLCPAYSFLPAPASLPPPPELPEEHAQPF